VNSVVTVDLLFRRAPFLRTLRRDVTPFTRILANARLKPLDDGQRAHIDYVTKAQPVDELTPELATYYRGESSNSGEFIASLGREMRDYLSTL